MQGNQYPAKRDFRAADFVRDLRESHGLTQNDLAQQITAIATKSKDDHPHTVSARTIYRIEDEGAVPGPRIKFALAKFFDVPIREIWESGRSRPRVAA